MKLLFDANLSPKLVRRLAELFPDSSHVFELRLGRLTSDEAIWQYAKSNGFVIVTADSDFLNLAAKHGAPPRVIRLENCNYKTLRIEVSCGGTLSALRNWSTQGKQSWFFEILLESLSLPDSHARVGAFGEGED